MGARFAVTGGREGWVRTVLTAVGVGLGVALLLVTTAVPNAIGARDKREDARTDLRFSVTQMPKADDTVVVAMADTEFRGTSIRGRLMQPEGDKAPLPPGISAYPKPGEMVVSPALARLLGAEDSALLRDRLDARIVGTIGEAGLTGPAELMYIKGVAGLHPTGYPVERIDHFGNAPEPEPLDPILLLLTLIVVIVLLMPVAVFIATAVRFGGERRDRRLAALRLIGADGRMVRRIAAGEAASGALLGLLVGAGVFLVVRQAASKLELMGISVFPQDIDPAPALVAVVAFAVPAAAVAVTLFALRGVVIEPLGVVRTAKPSRRRLWWRLVLPLAGLALLYPMLGQGNENGEFNQYMVTAGVVLILVGVTALIPWLVEAVVTRLGSGPVAWQLAVRRLQLSSGTAARLVNGIAVAVAGAIALQMLFAGIEGDYTKATGEDTERAQMTVNVPASTETSTLTAQLQQALAKTPGVASVTPPLTSAGVGEKPHDANEGASFTSGSCAALREVAKLPSCKDGDVFAVRGASYDDSTDKLAKPGTTLYVDPGYDKVKGAAVPFKVPAGLKDARPRELPTGGDRGGFLVTPSALSEAAGATMSGDLYLKLDPSNPDASDEVRTAAAQFGPLINSHSMVAMERVGRFDSIRTGLFVGATCVLLLIGASLLVSQLEQLRERRKLLSALVAFGTRRRTLSASVLWQTAVPVALGLALATAVGLTLGAVLLKMTAQTVAVDWASVLAMAGVGAGVVLVVTFLSLPPLMRLMRPEGLRTE
ncbi:ABC transporter permease [Streptomyces indicus]|nr:FtsX-like permease family protein [Streptomyces indicus]